MATTKKTDYLMEINRGLDAQLEKNVKALPKDFNKPRFMQNCMTLLQDGTDFSKYEPRTVVRTLLKAAYLDLDFFMGECYAIPYGNKLNFQTDYKGEIKLAKKYSKNPIKDIYARLVREGDVFEESVIDGEQKLIFKPKPFNKGKIIGTFAVCLFKDGSILTESMSIEDVENVRKNYAQKNSPAWDKSYGEMVKKVVLRRLCKLITLEFDTIEAQKSYSEGDSYETDNIVEVYSDAKEIIEENTATEPEEPAPAADEAPETEDGEQTTLEDAGF